MTRGKGKQILSQSELEGLKEEKRELEVALREAESGEYGQGTKAAGAVDTAAMKRQIAKLDKAIHDGQPPKVSAIDKDALIKEANEIRERLKIGLPTRFEMDHPAKAPGAVGKHLNWQARNAKDLKRYREIMQTVEPDDPTATDIEKLRLEK